MQTAIQSGAAAKASTRWPAVRIRPLAGLTRANLGRELLAGVSLIAISVPLNIGYAQIAGLPPQAGLYALVIPTIIYVIFVSSRQLVASPDASASALVFSSLLALGATQGNMLAMAAAQAILGGLFLVATGWLRLGFLSNFLSHPILVGFVSGLAAEILLSQVAKMLGVKLPSEGGFFQHLGELVMRVPHAQLLSVAVSVGALAILVLGRRYRPSVPWALVVIVVATLASSWFDLPSRGVSALGAVQGGMPRIVVPVVPMSTWLALIPSALALAIVAMAEGLMLSRSYAARREYPDLPDQDLIAMGMANIAAGFSSSYSIGSSGSRTAAMDEAGSRTQLPGLVLAGGTLLLLMLQADILGAIPAPAIGAIVAVAVWGLLSIPDYRHLWAESRTEFAVGVVCAVGVLVVGPIGGILISFVLALINLAGRASHPPLDILVGPEDPHVSLTSASGPGTETGPGIIILRLAAPLFFANGNRLVETAQDAVVRAPNPTRTLVLDLEGVTDIDVTGAASLRTLRTWLAERGIDLAYTRVRTDMARLLEHFGLSTGATQFTTNREAMTRLMAAGSAGS